MNSQTTSISDADATAVPTKRSPYRIGLLLLLFGFGFFGIIRIVLMTPFISAAQIQQNRAKDGFLRPIPDSSQFPSRSAPYNPSRSASILPAAAVSPLPSQPQVVTRMEDETHVVPTFDPITKQLTYTLQKVRVPVTTLESSNAPGTFQRMGATPSQDHPELEANIQRLANQFRSSGNEQRESLGKELSQRLNELFDARHQAQTARVQSLLAEVQQTQELLDKRLKLKSKIIERRLNELTGQHDELSWNTGTATSNFRSEFVPSPSGLPSGIPIGPPIFPLGAIAPSSVLSIGEQPPNGVAVRPVPMETIASGNDVPVTNGTAISQRIFMEVGFRLRKLLQDLVDEKSKDQDPNSSKVANELQNRIDETRAVWDFEKSTFESDLGSAQSEFNIVKEQLENAMELLKLESTKFSSGVGSSAELAKTKQSKSEAELQLLQIRSHIASVKKSLEWMENFQKKLAVLNEEPVLY